MDEAIKYENKMDQVLYQVEFLIEAKAKRDKIERKLKMKTGQQR